MDSFNKKKLSMFKKQIKTEQLEKKRVQIRKTLPYYDLMFNKSDDDSNNSKSRSTKFPISSIKREDYLNEEINEKERQEKYLLNIRRLSQTNYEERKQEIGSQITKVCGQHCFENMPQLRDILSLQITNYDIELLSVSELNQQHNEIENINWRLMLECFYLGKVQRTQGYEELSKRSFSFMMTHLMNWYRNQYLKQVNQSEQPQQLIQRYKYIKSIEERVEQILLQKLIKITDEKIDDEYGINEIISYLDKKMKVFLQIESQLGQQDQAERENISEIIYNYRSVLMIEKLVEYLNQEKVERELSIRICKIVNKYYAQYPLLILSQTQTQHKFNSNMENYLMNLHKQIKLYKNQRFPQQIDNARFELLYTSIKLLQSLFMNQQLRQYNVTKTIQIYETLTQVTFAIDVLFDQIINYVEYHLNILYFFSLTFRSLESMEKWLQKRVVIDYLNLLITSLHQFKQTLRTQQDSSIYTDQFYLNKISSIKDFEFYLIQSLSDVRSCVDNMQLPPQYLSDIKQMYDYMEYAYRKQSYTIKNCESKNKNTNQLSLFSLIFKDNVQYYDKKFNREISQNQMDLNQQEDSHQQNQQNQLNQYQNPNQNNQVFNPQQPSQNYNSGDVEI